MPPKERSSKLGQHTLNYVSYLTSKIFEARSGGHWTDLSVLQDKMTFAYRLCNSLQIPMIETQRTILEAIPSPFRFGYLKGLDGSLTQAEREILAREFEIEPPIV